MRCELLICQSEISYHSHCGVRETDVVVSTLPLLTMSLSVFVFVPGHPVQEGERNSSGDHTTQHPDGDPVHGSQTGTDFTSIAPASQEVVRGTEGGRGRHYEGLKWRPGPQSVSSPSSQDKGLLYPTSTLRGLSVAGAADRETLPFPEEGANNGADASGAAHLTDSPISARDGTHPYFHTERTLSTDTSNTETNPNGRLPQTQKALAYATSSVSNIMFGKDLHKYTVTQTSMHVDEHATTRAHPAVSSFSFLPLTSTPPQISSRTTWESGTDVIPSGRTVSEEKQPHSWRSHRSTGTLLSDLSSAVTSNPLKSSTEPPQYDSISADTDTEATALTSSSQGPGRTQSSTAHIAEFHTAVTTVAAASFHLNISQTDSLKSADVTSETAAFESSDKFDSAVELHTPTSSTQRKTSSRQSTESFTHSSYTSSTFTQTSKDIQTATQSTQRDLISPHVTTNDAPSSTDITKVNEQTLSFTSSSSTLRAALTMGGVVRDSADTGATSETLHPTHPLLHENSHTNSQAPVSLFSPSTSTHSSTPSNMLQTHTTFSGSSHVTRTPPPLTSSTSDSTLYTLLIDHKAMSTPLQTTKSTSLLTPRTHHHLPFPSSTNVPATHKHSHNNITTTHISPLLLTTAKSDYGDKSPSHGITPALFFNVFPPGMQADVCDWLLQCPEGYKCVSLLGTAKYSCSSVCRFDHCHHHGICTHHPDQLPVCHCAVGEDFWYMGPQCDVRMTQARLVGACLAILLLMVTLIGVLALVAVRRYRAVLIQAKVDQTRSSYRRFNHFDELSGRFWLRSWAGSADSMDNPAFTRSDELLHLRALDRPCCYHDDTLSLASTCTSHGPHINTIYPHSSQYGWRGSEMSMGDGVLDSGKASDLSVCSWPVEPIQWTPFPLLQQLASHKTPTVRVSRPRSYCEGMELVDLGKSWTA
uniref:EGF-like domain-containing protein n=1 Tax=Monopterus albus TaxID=43700 RepID=A0A3Q3K246_MONAL